MNTIEFFEFLNTASKRNIIEEEMSSPLNEIKEIHSSNYYLYAGMLNAVLSMQNAKPLAVDLNESIFKNENLTLSLFNFTFSLIEINKIQSETIGNWFFDFFEVSLEQGLIDQKLQKSLIECWQQYSKTSPTPFSIDNPCLVFIERLSLNKNIEHNCESVEKKNLKI